MKYLLDTNICVHFLRGKYGLIEKFEQLGTENFAISEITWQNWFLELKTIKTLKKILI
jgi:predicted nucleic acid-binding protein